MNYLANKIMIIFFALLAQSTTAYALQYCDRLKVTYPGGHLSGTYTDTNTKIHDAPLYKARATSKNQSTEDGFLYLYRQKVGFTETGFVWITSSEKPSVSEWRANSYADAILPEQGLWNYNVRVICLDYAERLRHAVPEKQRKRDAPSDPKKVADVMVLYTPEALEVYRNKCSGEAKEACGVTSYIHQSIKAFNDAMRNSGLDETYLRTAHIGPTKLSDALIKSLFPKPATQQDVLIQAKGISSFLRRTDDRSKLPLRARTYVDEIHERRAAFKADLVHIVFGNKGSIGTCGLGEKVIGGRNSEPNKNDGFGFTRHGCNTHGILAISHELGHNFGLSHSYYTEYVAHKIKIPSDASQGRGYTDINNKFITIMAYLDQCAINNLTCDPIPHFSNPNIKVKRSGKDVRTGDTKTNAADRLKKNFKFISGLYKEEDTDLSFWTRLDDNLRSDYKTLDVKHGTSTSIELYAYNNSGVDISIVEIFKGVQKRHGNSRGGLQHYSVSSTGKNGCAVNKVLKNNQMCTLEVYLSASSISLPQENDFIVGFRYKKDGDNTVHSKQEPIKFDVN